MLKGRGKERRAQATVFVILGLVLVVTFSFALFARSILTAGKLEQKAQNILTDALETSSVTYYVENCLEQVSTEALLTLGKQGGKIHMRDGLAGVDFYILNESGRETPINYGIKPNTFCKEVDEEVPDYPRARTEISRFTSIYNSGACRQVRTSGFLGQMGFDLLCSKTGANNVANSRGDYSLACPTRYISSTENNTQTLLENYVSELLPSCTDFEFYENLFGHNISIPETTELKTIVTYGLDSLTIDTTFPFIVKIGKQSVKTFHNFTYISPVPYREIYSYAAELVTEEARNITFNLTQDYKKVPSYRPSFDITYIENPCLESWSGDCQEDMLYDDIFIIKDENTILEGDNYRFVFALKNRKPVLDYIHTTEADANFDIKIKENETLYLRPEGYDPDDKNVSYIYRGWKENYDEIMDIGCCMDANDDAMIFDTPPCYLSDCIDKYHTNPRNWTTSNLFVRTKQEASINLTRDDMGLHYLQIYAYEDSELYDYQNISILVFDLPTAVPNVSNGFDDIDNNHASIEDPFVLDASSSIASMVMGSLENSAFDWIIIRNYTDGTSRKLGRLNTLNKNITLPNDIITQGENFIFYKADDNGVLLDAPFNGGDGDITFGLFNETEPSGATHTLELRTSSDAGASPIYSEPAQLEVEVYQCLPHRADPIMLGSEVRNMYPYNRTLNTFEYNHTCCADEFTLGSDYGEVIPRNGAICYEEDYYGMLVYLLPYSTDNLYGVPIYGTDNNPILTEDVEYYFQGSSTTLYDLETRAMDLQNNTFNDIYRLRVERYCGGNRGNVCGGPIELHYEQHRSCNDAEPNEDERCSGSRLITWSPYISSRYTTHSYFGNCANYGVWPSDNPINNPQSTNTFERYISLFRRSNDNLYGFFSDADGICNNEDRCFSTEGSPSYRNDWEDLNPGDQDTPLLCQGGCDRDSGTCNTPINCTCSIDQCGAECEEGGSIIADFRETNMCWYGCSDQTCRFMNNKYCPDVCVRYGNVPSDVSDCQNLEIYEPREYTVYFGGEDACEEDGCTWDDISNRMQILNKSYCYSCDKDGCTQGDRCDAREDGNRCYYQTTPDVIPSCNQGACSGITYDVLALEDACEEDGYPPQCTTTGWTKNTDCVSVDCHRCVAGSINTITHDVNCPNGYSQTVPPCPPI